MMTETDPNAGEDARPTMTDEEFFEARRETMGKDYPGDEAMRQFDREADAAWQAELQRDAADAQSPTAEASPPAAEASPAAGEGASAGAQAAEQSVQAPEWNAGDWLRETFKDDPAFKDLSAEDMAKLEALANEKHQEIAGEVQEWASEKSAEWTQELKTGLEEGLSATPELQSFAETRLADGDFSEEDKAALKEIAEQLSPQEAAGVVRPVVEAVHEIHGELIDGVEVIVEHAVEDVQEIVAARAEMPGGDGAEVQSLQQKLEDAPEQIDHAFQFEREQADYEWGKVEDRLELVEAGTDPKDLPPDTDTYQVDDNADQYENAEA
jgi:hypothetical protein